MFSYERILLGVGQADGGTAVSEPVSMQRGGEGHSF